MKKYFLFILLFALKLSAQDTYNTVWKFETKKVSDCEYDLLFKVNIDAGWHLYSLKKVEGDGAPNPTVFKFKKGADYELVGKVTESPTHTDYDKDLELTTIYHEKTATFTQRIKLLNSGKIKIKGKYEFQVCNQGQCKFPLPEDFEFELTGTDKCIQKGVNLIEVKETPEIGLQISKNACICDTQAILAGTKASTVEPFGMTVSANACECDTAAILAKHKKAEPNTPTLVSNNGSNEGGDCNPWGKLLLGLLAGLGAVLMPCVYSLIPLTVSFFLKRSKSRAQGIRNSLLYGFFIVITFVIPTMLITIVFGPDALSNIATNTWLNLFFFVLFVVFALSFFGLFEITLPGSWSTALDKKADKGGVIGIFFMAATLVVVSFSCTAGFLGSLLPALAAGDSYICPLAGFTGFGMGIAFPFMFFAFFPSMLNSLPKSGGWMTTFKVSVAFIELALAVKFLSNADNVNEWGLITREVFIALWVAVFGMMTFYLMGVFRTSHDDDTRHISVGRILFATITMAFTFYLIPGLWGAPLKIISSFPPPHHYAESPGLFHQEPQRSGAATPASGNPEIAALESKRIVGPEGLLLFKDDYESAMKYAKLVNKPLFVDFTGLACVNCRLMESKVWVTPEVFPMLRDSVVIVSLYVDSRVELPASQQKEVDWLGKKRTLETVGSKWAYLQSTRYKSNAQPQYVLLNFDESVASNGTMGTETDQNKFGGWLQDGLANFRKKGK